MCLCVCVCVRAYLYVRVCLGEGAAAASLYSGKMLAWKGGHRSAIIIEERTNFGFRIEQINSFS